MCFQVNCTALGQMLEPTDARRQREQGFNEHPLTPGFVFTKLEVECRLARLLEAKIAQDNRFLIELMGEWAKGLVVDIRCVPVPSDDFASVIDQPAQLDPDNPAAVAFAFLADLLLAASFAHGMNQFNPIGVDDREESRVSQQVVTPVAMDVQRPLDAGAIRQFDKQRLKVAFQPTVEGAKKATFKRIEQSYRHQLAWIQIGIRTLRHLAPTIIYQTEQRNDKVFGGHGSFLFVV